jgi:NADH:ubiquinone oxidoreductase subunit
MPMDRGRALAYMPRMTTIGTRIFTWLNGRRIGRDAAGNVYYEEKRARPGYRPRRWVIYAGEPEASVVPPEWHAWLHYTTDAPIKVVHSRPWLKPHIPNLTGTPLSYRPPGHDYQGGRRPTTTGDYEAWTPEMAGEG